jgi:glycosyltransferase involved in cell wall biosynthesis
MKSFSVIVTAHNNAAVLARTLQSVEDSLAWHAAGTPGFRGGDAEVFVVDDGSTDETPEVLHRFTVGKPHYSLVRHARLTNLSCARNAGVTASSGELLFFLDGDDLFLSEHILRCTRALQDPGRCYVKTGVRLSDPVHPDWLSRINLCVRRRCHDAVGGFPDYHLCLRAGDGFAPVADVFNRCEDQFYNMLVCGLFGGVRETVETVEYRRYPGNSFDRQYAKFCQPFGQFREDVPADYHFRLQMAEIITRHRLDVLRRQPGARP